MIWENGSIRDLGTLNVYRGARANAVNDRGQVVGDGDVLPFGNNLFFWEKGTTFDIPQAGGPIGSLFALNDGGEAVGYTPSTRTSRRAPFW